MSNKQIVTGAAGFIGSSVAAALLERGDQVVGVDCLTDYYSPALKQANLAPLLENDRFDFIQENINDLDWAPILDGATTVFHLAAQAGVRASWGKSFSEYTDRNVLATQTLLEAMRSASARMVFSSSSSVYGETDRLPMSEEDLPRPHSPYGVTKLAAEHLCGLYWHNYEVHTATLRYFTVYGPRQRPDMAFHRFIRAALQGEEITIYGDGEQTRDFTYVEDVVKANLLAAERAPGGAVYNIGGGSRVTVNHVLQQIEQVTDRTLRIKCVEYQKGDVRHTYADTTRARKELGFEPEHSLEEGLGAEAKWIKSTMHLLGEKSS